MRFHNTDPLAELSYALQMTFDTKKIWDACGEAFDRFTTAGDAYSDNIERPAIERLLGEIKGARLLDLGCGSLSMDSRPRRPSERLIRRTR